MTLRGRLATYLAVFAVLVLVIVYDRYSRMADARAKEERVERDSFTVLAAASTAEELTEAVGNLGIVLPTLDGGWVAIRYLDSHGSGWSSAVARDSGGGWFVSRERLRPIQDAPAAQGPERRGSMRAGDPGDRASREPGSGASSSGRARVPARRSARAVRFARSHDAFMHRRVSCLRSPSLWRRQK